MKEITKEKRRINIKFLFHELRNYFTKEKYHLTFPPQAGGNRREGDIAPFIPINQ